MPKDIIGSGRFRLGVNLQTDSADSVSPTNAISRVVGEDADTRALVEQYLASASSPPTISLRKARGSAASPADVTIDDLIGAYASEARSTTFFDTASIRMRVRGAVVAAQRPGSWIEFLTNNTNVAPAQRMIIIGGENTGNALGIVGISNIPFTQTDLPTEQLTVRYEGALDAEIGVERVNSDAIGPQFELTKARGTVAARQDVVNNDELGNLNCVPYSGGYKDGARVSFWVDGTFVSGQAPPTRIEFWTNVANGSITSRAAIYNNGFMAIGNDLTAVGNTAALGLLTLGGNSTVEEYLQRSSADTSPARLAMRKTRGTVAAPADAVSGDYMLYLAAETRATSIFETSSIRMKVDGTVTGAQRPPSAIEFWTNANNAAAQAQAAIYNNGFLVVGPDPVSVGNTAALGLVTVAGNSTVEEYVYRASADATPPRVVQRKTRGTQASPGDVVSGDYTFYLATEARATSIFETSSIRMKVDGTVTGAQRPPSAIEFWTNANNAAATANVALYNNGFLVVGSAPVAVGNTAALGLVTVAGNSTVEEYLYRASADTTPARLAFRKTRGTQASPADVVNGDYMLYLAAEARATSIFETASIRMRTDAATVGAQRPASAIEFWTNVNNTAQALRLTVDSTGRASIGTAAPTIGGNNDGAIQILSTAPLQGIYLGNTANAATNVLDWYEEGTYTPTIGFGTAANAVGVTYGTQTGKYTRIGNMIHVRMVITLTSKGSSTGQISLSLPASHPITSSIGAVGMSGYWTNFNGTIPAPLALVYDSTLSTPNARMSVAQNASSLGSGPPSLAQDTFINNNTSLEFHVCYQCG